CLSQRWLTLGIFLVLVGATGYATVTRLGREFMPELEEGNLWIRGTFPLNMALERVAVSSEQARALIRSYPEVQTVVPMIGRPDDGTDPTGFYNCEIFVPLRPAKHWPKVIPRTGWLSRWQSPRPRAKEELVKEMNAELSRKLPGID